ncbi:hypothetical protein D3C78_1816810 [compost metagenome]
MAGIPAEGEQLHPGPAEPVAEGAEEQLAEDMGEKAGDQGQQLIHCLRARTAA